MVIFPMGHTSVKRSAIPIWLIKYERTVRSVFSVRVTSTLWQG